MTTTLQIRIDKDIKTKAQKIFKEIGIDMSSGVKLFLSNIVNTGSLTFTPRTKNGHTEEQEDRMLREVDEALKYGKRYKNARELHNDIIRDIS